MKLEGFRCDQCHKESGKTSGGRWLQVTPVLLSTSGWAPAMVTSQALHFCSPKCLVDYHEGT